MTDERNDVAASSGGALASTERGMAAHRLFAFTFMSLGRYPRRMRLKENHRRS